MQKIKSNTSFKKYVAARHIIIKKVKVAGKLRELTLSEGGYWDLTQTKPKRFRGPESAVSFFNKNFVVNNSKKFIVVRGPLGGEYCAKTGEFIGKRNR